MKRNIYLTLYALLLFTAVASAQCGSNCYFYGGDFNANDPNSNGLANEQDVPVPGPTAALPYGAATYQNFLVSSPIKVTGLFTNNLSNFINPTSAYWEIRLGVGTNNQGFVVGSGTGTIGAGNYTHTPTGRSGYGYTEYKDWVSGLNVVLNAVGVYWLAVVPQDPTSLGRSFNSNTDGLNQVGTEIDNQQYFNSGFFPASAWVNANSPTPPLANACNCSTTFARFSSGVYDDPLYSGSAPEPSSLVLLGSGLVSIAGVVRRRMANSI